MSIKIGGLNGFCDFIISSSPEQLMLNAAVIALVEAKNENITGGLGQCIAKMVAADMFNKSGHNDDISTLYGIVTTGTAWKFLKLRDGQVMIDLDEYAIESPDKIMGIISSRTGSPSVEYENQERTASPFVKQPQFNGKS